MQFRKFLKQWLGYSRRERTGSLVLIAILLVVLIARTVRRNDTDVTDLSHHEGVDFKSTPSLQDKPTPSLRAKSMQSLEDKPKPSLRAKSMQSLQVTSMPGRGSQSEISNSKADQVDINMADSAGLEALPGIGPVLSVRIIKYRYLLGYYYNVDQLKDVYGLDQDVIEINRHRFTCDTTMVRKINLNTAGYRELLRHPYIDRSQVEGIINYRQFSGLIADINVLIQNRIFTVDELVRLKPYLKFK